MSEVSADVRVAEVTRQDVCTGSERVESWHRAHAAVTDADGHVLAALGDAAAATFVRSAVKPLQAALCLDLIEAAGIAAPSSEQVAVAWASHRGEPRHLDAVAGLLARAEVPPEALTCPPATAQADPGAAPTRLQHNCSGKHALFALAGRALGCAGPDLLDPDGPLQSRLLAGLDDRIGPLPAVGVDGCGAPAAVAPLSNLATAFARLATEDRFAAVRDAGLAHPGLVGGEGRLESALLDAGVVAKVGAEGVYGVGWRDPDGRGRGLAIKATDGAGRGVAAATNALLERLEVVPVGSWEPPPPLGGGRPAGRIRPTAAVDDLARAVAVA